MFRTQRLVVLAIVVATSFAAACKKKADPAPAPATVPVSAPSPTCDKACQDSIAKARADSIDRANSERERMESEARARASAGARAALEAKVYFEYDQSDLSADARAVLDAKLPVLRANPGMRIRVSGHADERGSDEYNLALGQRRAAAAKRYLTDQGIDGGRVDIVSYGEERPASEGDSEDAFRKNRRAEFEIVAGGDNIVVPK
ncbi:MAG: peptidoglycan-associated lipoprotein Pal [Gemmatimonadaceae bacterium]